MKINIFQSIYNWEETIEILKSQKINNIQEDEVEHEKYYEFQTFIIKNKDEELEVDVKMFLKKKMKEPTEWQYVLTNIINEEQKDYMNFFMPSISNNFDAILLFKNPVSKNNNVFFTTFGQSHHDIDDFIDISFGINFAEKTIKNENVTMKNVNFFQQNKLKAITNYRRNTSNSSRPTESYTSITGYPEDKKRYGTSIACSNGVTFNVSGKIDKFRDKVSKLIIDIDEVISKGIVLNKFPRLSIEKDINKIKRLDEMLLQSLKKFAYDENINISRYYEKNSELIFLDQLESLKIFEQSNKVNTITDFSEENEDYLTLVGKFIKTHNIKDINSILLEINNDNNRYIKLKNLLHVEIVDSGKDYLLQNSRWGIFNTEFLDLINKSLESINLEYNFYGNVTEFEGGEGGYIDAFVDTYPKNIYKKLHEKFIKGDNPNFIIKGRGIELADIINIKNNELIAVKTGLNTSLSMYSLEQSMLATNALIHQGSFNFESIKDELNESGFKKLKNVKKSSILWTLPFKKDGKPVGDMQHSYNVRNGTFKLSDLGSVLLKNKIVEWSQFSIENRLEPVIYLESPTDTSK